MFTCVGWQVTLCDPTWQVTSHSSEMGFPRRAISAFTFVLIPFGSVRYTGKFDSLFVRDLEL